MKRWHTGFVVGWAIWMAFFAAYEGFALKHEDEDPPLTQVVTTYIPWWITIPFLWWLLSHFTIRYAKKMPL